MCEPVTEIAQPNTWQQVSEARRMAFEPSQEQALAVFTASGEAARFLVSQKWQVTYFVLTAYVALTAAPRLIRNVANWVWVATNWGCVFLAAVTAVLAWVHLCSLHREHKDRLAEVQAAAKELPVVLQIHGKEADEPGLLIVGLVAAIWIGAWLVIWINVAGIRARRAAEQNVARQSRGNAGL
jgi:hypothetical protein